MHLQTTTTTTTLIRTRRASPQLDDEPEMEEAMRQVRVVVRTMLGGRTIEQSAGLADVSTNTLVRILRGENLTLATFAKIVSRLGGNLVIKVER
jgi:hypothetical protein